jgi:hypothetical protein
MWIEQRGRQHRAYYRNPMPEKPRTGTTSAVLSEPRLLVGEPLEEQVVAPLPGDA